MKLLVILGATATGKSALAVECAKRLNGEVISADAFLIYRGLNIGTAKPSGEERQGIVHHMIDVCGANEPFSVSDFERLALPIIEDVIARGKTPVICGGTGFYINALLYKSSFGNAPANAAIRKKYEEIAREKGNAYLHALLAQHDSESAARLHENDVKRVIRALEIFELTGKKKSEQSDGNKPRFPFQAFAFDYSREELYRRIDLRVDEMFKAGLLDEVKELLQSGISENAQSMQAIGYKEIVQGLKNGDLQSTMSDIIKKNTRNYAKRQLTFFKRTENLHWITPKPMQEACEEVLRVYDGRREN